MLRLWLSRRQYGFLLFLELGCDLLIVRLINLLPRISNHYSLKRLKCQIGFFGTLTLITSFERWILCLLGWWKHFHYLASGFDWVLVLKQSHLVNLIQLLEILVNVRVAKSRNFWAGVGGPESVHSRWDIQLFLNEAIWVLEHFLFKSFNGNLSRGPNLFLVRIIRRRLCLMAERSYLFINLSCVNFEQLL